MPRDEARTQASHRPPSSFDDAQAQTWRQAVTCAPPTLLTIDRRVLSWREEADYLLFHFPTWAKARATQHWIDRSGIAGRPMLARFDGPQMRVGDG